MASSLTLAAIAAKPQVSPKAKLEFGECIGRQPLSEGSFEQGMLSRKCEAAQLFAMTNLRRKRSRHKPLPDYALQHFDKGASARSVDPDDSATGSGQVGARQQGDATKLIALSVLRIALYEELMVWIRPTY